MNYHKLSTSTDESIVGKVTQTEGMGGLYDLRKSTSVWKIPSLEPMSFEPDLDYFNLEKKAKLTDVISTGLITAPGFILNEKVRSIFDQYKLPKHRYYPAKVVLKGVKHDYFWFHIEENIVLDNVIDFGRSEFELRHSLRFLGEPSKLSLHSMDDLAKVWKEYAGIQDVYPLQLVLRNDLKDYDMLAFRSFRDRIVINEPLKNQLEHDQVSGFEFMPSFPISF